MATFSLTMQAAIFHLSQLKTELERAKNTIEQFSLMKAIWSLIYKIA